LEQNTEKAAELYVQGVEAYTRGDLKSAVATWRRVLEFDPDHRDAKRGIDRANKRLEFLQQGK